MTGLPDLTGLANLALGRPAAQSSTSRWSKPDDAQGAVNGRRTGRFSFHTGLDDPQAWWRVDLGAMRPIRHVVLWNREDAAAERACRLAIETSADGQAWEVIGNTGERIFGGARSGTPFVLDCGAGRSARFVRLRRTEPGALHLDEVEVYGPSLAAEQRADSYWTAIGEDPAVVSGTPEGRGVLRFDATHGPGPVRSLTLVRAGRLGNAVMQIVNAVHFARKHGIARIHLDHTNPGKMRGVKPLDGIEFHAGPADLSFGTDLMTRMYYRAGFPRTFADLDGAAALAIAKAYVEPLIGYRFPPPPPRAVPALHIHLRAGDIFRAGHVHHLYTQPPLAFYQLVVRDAARRLGVREVVLVYEDEGNPCVGALRDWLAQEGIACTNQSGMVNDDMAALMGAENVVMAYGTFCYPVFLLSQRLRHVYAFRGFHGEEVLLARGTSRHLVEDAAGDYIPQDQWRNEPEQRARMLDYPIEALRLVDPA